MPVTDPISDMLTRIRNACLSGHPSVSMPGSKIKAEIARILKAQGFIEDYKVVEGSPQSSMVVKLKYVGGRRERRSVISKIKRVSKPGCRVYSRVSQIPWVRSGMGVAILSTPKGVLTGQQARRLGVGGEVICHVW
ncbi:MAG: 30S ribosomal protein S8 [Anaerolineales bacterium]|nr:MAG: 30S ribosomal protein S8 [Anaerolineales bacterium]